MIPLDKCYSSEKKWRQVCSLCWPWLEVRKSEKSTRTAHQLKISFPATVRQLKKKAQFRNQWVWTPTILMLVKWINGTMKDFKSVLKSSELLFFSTRYFSWRNSLLLNNHSSLEIFHWGSHEHTFRYHSVTSLKEVVSKKGKKKFSQVGNFVLS